MLRCRVSTAGTFLLLFVAATACAVGAELGSAPVPVPDAGPEIASGGALGSGGTGNSAGSRATGGVGGGGGGYDASAGAPTDARASGDTRFDGALAVDSATGCVATQKSCDGRCVVPDPRLGCALTGCDPCSAPANGVAQCIGTECDFSCLTGYVRSGSSCVVGEGGGGDGAADASKEGGPSVCLPSQCGGCLPLIQAPCRQAGNTCGCQYPFSPGY